MCSSCCVVFVLAVTVSATLWTSSQAAVQQPPSTCSGPSAADDVVNKIKKVASKYRGKVKELTGEKSDEDEDEMKGVKKLQASNPISALVSALQSERHLSPTASISQDYWVGHKGRYGGLRDVSPPAGYRGGAPVGGLGSSPRS